MYFNKGIEHKISKINGSILEINLNFKFHHNVAVQYAKKKIIDVCNHNLFLFIYDSALIQV